MPCSLFSTLFLLIALVGTGVSLFYVPCLLSNPRCHSLFARRCSPQALSNTAYAVAELGLEPDDEWMDAFVGALRTVMGDLEPQHLSNTLWALARVGYFPGTVGGRMGWMHEMDGRCSQ